MERDILFFRILPNLPVRPLSRLKCVCKEWFELISNDPDFLREQSRSSMASPVISFIGPSGLEFLPTTTGSEINVPDPPLEFFKGIKIRIFASSNGLLCVSKDRFDPRSEIFVCNPVTMKWSSIPRPEVKWECLGLAFDPLRFPQAYKLVCPYTDDSDFPSFQFAVFSSDSGVWTPSKEKIVVPVVKASSVRGSTFVDGVLYWLLLNRVFWFDPERDLAGVLSLPPSSDGLHPPAPELGVCEDVLTYSRITREKTVEVWKLVGFQWESVSQVSLDSAIQGAILRICDGCILPYQGGEFFCFMGSNGKSVVYYNMKTGEVTKHRITEPCPSFFSYNYSLARLPDHPSFEGQLEVEPKEKALRRKHSIGRVLKVIFKYLSRRVEGDIQVPVSCSYFTW